MLRMVLIDMPFSLIECANFGISQIKTYCDKTIPTLLHTDILYLSHDFYHYFGNDIYRIVNADFYEFYKFETNKHLWVDSMRKSGLEVKYFGGQLGDWIFRHAAFPHIPDNQEEYFAQYYTNDVELQKNIVNKKIALEERLNELIIHYKLDQYDIVGFSSRFQQQMPSLAMARLLKARNSSVITIMGGPNCEPPMGAAIAGNLDMIDYVLSGRRFLLGIGELVQNLSSGRPEKILNIPGVYSKDKCMDTGEDLYEESTEDDINMLLDVDYDTYFESIKMKLPKEKFEPVLFLETSRGCSWGEKKRCSFCAIDGYNPKHRAMRPPNAIQYLNMIFLKYKDKCKYYIFVDSTLPKEYLTEVFPYVDIPAESLLLYECRVDLTVDEVACLEKYNIRLLIAGLESFSSDSLLLLNKGTRAYENIRFLKLCRKHKLAVNWNILVGIPGETDESIRQNIDVSKIITHLYPPTGVWLISFQGNCDYNENPHLYNITVSPNINSLSLLYPFDNETLKKMTYFYQNESAAISRAKAVLIHKLSKYAQQWKDAWYQASEAELPSLVFKDEFSIIDTRVGRNVVIDIDEKEYSILILTHHGCTIDNLMSELGMSRLLLEEKLKSLEDKDLLFRDDNNYLSLVCE